MKTRARKYLDWIAQQPCVRCGATPVEVAHVRAFRSPKTDLLLARRDGINAIACVPLCPPCHRTGPDSVHAIGEHQFGISIGRGSEYLWQKAGSLIAEYYLS